MQVKIDDHIILIGTAHISQQSVDEVTKAIETYDPDVVAIELCPRRYKNLTEKDQWENTPVTALLKSNNAYFLLAQTFLSSVQRKLGKDQGVQPGSEMIAAINEAKKHQKDIELVDRDIAVTLKRAWKKMGFKEKFRVLWEFLKAMVGFDEEEMEEINLEELMDQDMISTMLEEFGEIAPSVTTVLIHERDQYIAQKIKYLQDKGKTVVAVVGAGHLHGIETHLKNPDFSVDLSCLEQVPQKRFSVLKTIGYLIPVLFAALIIYGFYTGGIERSLQMFLYWFLINGIFSAIGTAIARAHPLSILTAFVAAPITSLNPAVAAGWVAGYVEAKLRTPVIKDFQGLSTIENFSDFWKNRVIRLLLVVALANVGSMIGTIIAFPYVTSLLG
ncbi:MAG: TraB/GumN family protein [Thermoplasmatota archaeon]